MNTAGDSDTKWIWDEYETSCNWHSISGYIKATIGFEKRGAAARIQPAKLGLFAADTARIDHSDSVE